MRRMNFELVMSCRGVVDMLYSVVLCCASYGSDVDEVWVYRSLYR